MKKKSIIIVSVLVSLVIALFLSKYIFREEDVVETPVLTMAQLKTDGEYRYCGTPWLISQKELNDYIPYKIVRDQEKVSSTTGRVFYRSKYPVSLDGYSTKACFEFLSDHLNTVQFHFHLGDDYELWYEKRVEELKTLYGEETDTLDNASEECVFKGYKWETENTTLQIILVTGDSIKPTVMIGVGDR